MWINRLGPNYDPVGLEPPASVENRKTRQN